MWRLQRLSVSCLQKERNTEHILLTLEYCYRLGTVKCALLNTTEMLTTRTLITRESDEDTVLT